MRRPGRAEEGSLPVALLLVMVSTSLTAVLAATSATRALSVRHTVSRQQLLAVAQSGFEAAMGRIRAAVDTSGNGLRSSLPCGPFGGRVGDTTSIGYTVAIVYRTVGNTLLGCLTGSGTLVTPAFADLSSTASDPATGTSRTLTSRYVLRTSNQNIAGGLVPMVAKLSGSTVCLDAGSATPAAGAAVLLQPCVSGSRPQTFAYTSLLQLQLVSSASDLVPNGLCADGGPVPHGAADVAVTMQPCLSVTPGRQQWSINDSNRYEGTSDGTNLDGHCLTPQGGSPGTAVVVRASCNNDFNPEPSVGAGAAGASTGQLVNYNEFGRCLDVAEYNWQRAWFWIWPCKQAPSVAGVSWNQKWKLPTLVPGPTGSSGFIVNNPPAISPATACLQSTMTSASDAYVTLVRCPAAGTVAAGPLRWTVYGDTGAYATSFTIVDGVGRCLTARDPTVTGGTVNMYGHDVSPAITVDCNGSTLQKWNADPNVLKVSPLTMVTEK